MSMVKPIDRDKVDSFMAEHKLDVLILMDPALGHLWTGVMPLEHRDFALEERALIFVFLRRSSPFIVYRNATVPAGFKVDGVPDVCPCGLMLAEKSTVLADQLRKRGFTAGRVGIEKDLVPALAIEELSAAFPGSRFSDVSAFSRQLRVPKTDFQINCIRKALDASERGILAVLSELAKRLDSEETTPAQGIRDLYRRTILDQGVQLYDAEHWVDITNTFKRGRRLTLDLVTCYHGMLADFCVPLVLDDRAPDELVQQSGMGQRIIRTIAEAIKPGMTGAEAERAADSSLEESFNKEYEVLDIRSRWVVHGIGLNIHEEPRIGRDHRDASRTEAKRIIRFVPGTVVSIEICGLMEQMYLMTASGFERMGRMVARVYTFADVRG